MAPSRSVLRAGGIEGSGCPKGLLAPTDTTRTVDCTLSFAPLLPWCGTLYISTNRGTGIPRSISPVRSAVADPESRIITTESLYSSLRLGRQFGGGWKTETLVEAVIGNRSPPWT